MAKTRGNLLCQQNNNNKDMNNRILLLITFHLALSGVGGIDSLWPILHATVDMRRVFQEELRVVYRRLKNLKDILVRSKIKGERSRDKGMR